ncbi:hypothetical protein [Alkalihalobacillus sp. CinArs1]|uniref:hypothetical protein n=1 Tax=Alkalihalobacillus sp. CinArs1 TaxID=2995314 RepID=UPI0022DD3B0B|nr:hypothetical protein [Alkalihalobacillus sp. CinArs1]
MKKTLSLISIIIPIVLSVLIINFLLDGIALRIQGLPIVLPIVLCPVGAAFGVMGYRMNKDHLSRIGIIFNLVLFIFPIAYNIVGTLSHGV